MISPLDRARLLDAEMELQRSWLELNLRELSSAARASPWARLNAFKLGTVGISILKHRSMWLGMVSLLMNLYRRYSRKERT